MANIAGKIRQVLKTYPLIANSLFYGGACLTSEVAIQTVLRKASKAQGETHAMKMIASAGIVGACASGPGMYLWYKWLDSRYKGTGPRTIFRKLLLDHIVMNPYTYIVLIMVGVVISSLVMSNSWADTFKKLSERMDKRSLRIYTDGDFTSLADEHVVPRDYARLQKLDSLFWLPAQAVNFGFVAPHHRIFYIGVCLLAWNSIKLGMYVAARD